MTVVNPVVDDADREDVDDGSFVVGAAKIPMDWCSSTVSCRYSEGCN